MRTIAPERVEMDKGNAGGAGPDLVAGFVAGALLLAAGLGGAGYLLLDQYLEGTRYGVVVPGDPRAVSAVRFDRRTGEAWLIDLSGAERKVQPDPAERLIEPVLEQEKDRAGAR